jgi:hypothetical protein
LSNPLFCAILIRVSKKPCNLRAVIRKETIMSGNGKKDKGNKEKKKKPKMNLKEKRKLKNEKKNK